MSTHVKEFKVKVNKEQLKEQTLFEQRFILAKKYGISVNVIVQRVHILNAFFNRMSFDQMYNSNVQF